MARHSFSHDAENGTDSSASGSGASGEEQLRALAQPHERQPQQSSSGRHRYKRDSLRQTASDGAHPKRSDDVRPKRHWSWSADWPLAVAIGIVLLGAALIAYPVISSAWNNELDRRKAQAYENYVNAIPQAELDTQLARAKRYNESIDGVPVLDPLLSMIRDTPDYRNYLSLLPGPQNAMATLVVPAINLKLPIMHGTDAHTLNEALGHLYGSDLPVGGTNRHAVITGHTGLIHATMFDRLTELKKGDEFFITVQGQELGYRVISIQQVNPKDASSLVRVNGKDLVTLLTCTPYGINSHRLLVTGDRIIPTPSHGDVGRFAWAWWMILLIIGALLGMLIAGRLLWWLIRLKRQRREENRVSEEESARGKNERAGKNQKILESGGTIPLRVAEQ
ncbi:MAG: class C sortase [Actinomycetaceae bacterium]|nr:class C sortase [Arcanobacterium sp.]MDD7687311.1 class C sortase [Actinomycetaceae bacterium]MDY5274080.1 class C sortase [Arcanobacterium sp.]